MGENTVQNPKIRNSRMMSFLEIGTRRGIASNRDVTATIPVSRIGSRDCPRGNEPLAPRNRCLAPDLRPCFLHAASLLVRHFERIVARNKLITIVIEIFLVQTFLVYLSACMNYGDVLSCLLFINPFRPLDMRNEAGAQVLLAIIELYCSPFTTRFFLDDRREMKGYLY